MKRVSRAAVALLLCAVLSSQGRAAEANPRAVFLEFAKAAGERDVAKFRQFFSNGFVKQMESLPAESQDKFFQLTMLALPSKPAILSEKTEGDRYVVRGEGQAMGGASTGETTLKKENGTWKVMESRWDFKPGAGPFAPVGQMESPNAPAKPDTDRSGEWEAYNAQIQQSSRERKNNPRFRLNVSKVGKGAVSLQPLVETLQEGDVIEIIPDRPITGYDHELFGKGQIRQEKRDGVEFSYLDGNALRRVKKDRIPVFVWETGTGSARNDFPFYVVRPYLIEKGKRTEYPIWFVVRPAD